MLGATCCSALEDVSVPQQRPGTSGVLPSQVSHDGCLSHGPGYGSRWTVPSGSPLGLDAMAEIWLRQCLYAFPLVALLSGVLAMVHQDGVHLLVEAPFWPVQIWFSELISLLDRETFCLKCKG